MKVLFCCAYFIVASLACTPANNLFRENVDIGTLSDFDSAPVGNPNLLGCSFESRCAWFNNGGDLTWQTGDFKAAANRDLFTQYFRSSELPSGKFLWTGGPGGLPRQTAVLAANVQCQDGDGTLTFRTWASDGDPNVKVCMAPSQFSGVATNCLKSISPRVDGSRSSVTIPGSVSQNSPFQIQLQATNFNSPSIVLLDDVRYTARPCGGGGGGGGSGGGCRSGAVETDCSLLDCDFNEGDSCFYDVRGEGSRKGQWNHGSGRVGNAATGPRTHSLQDINEFDGYAFVGSERGGRSGAVHVLESPLFSTKSGAVVTFDSFKRNVKGTLKACIDNLSNCPYSLTQNIAKDGWRLDEGFQVPPGEHKILFVAEDLEAHVFMALDRIRFDSRDGACSVCGDFLRF